MINRLIKKRWCLVAGEYIVLERCRKFLLMNWPALQCGRLRSCWLTCTLLSPSLTPVLPGRGGTDEGMPGQDTMRALVVTGEKGWTGSWTLGPSDSRSLDQEHRQALSPEMDLAQQVPSCNWVTCEISRYTWPHWTGFPEDYHRHPSRDLYHVVLKEWMSLLTWRHCTFDRPETCTLLDLGCSEFPM